MPYQSSSRFTQLRWLQTVACVVAVLGALMLVGLGLVGWGESYNAWMIAAGGFGLFVAIMLMTFAPLILKMESTLARQLDELRDLNDKLDKQAAKLDAIAEHTRISDAAKSLAHRAQEVEALRYAIREEVHSEQWEVALNLIDEMERRFGARQEAERLREELDDARREALRAKLNAAVEAIEAHFQDRQWDRASAEIERLRRALPNEAKVQSLLERMRTLQERHKEELKAAWAEAIRRSDTDQAIDILKALDQYLTPAEAQELQDSARHVFKEKLLQLGVQFRFAVTDKRWQDALAIGLELIGEFPNSRMASEVREALDALRERAHATSAEPNARIATQAG